MKRKSIIIAVSVAAVVILGGAGFYSYSSYQKSQQEIASHIAELKEDNNNDLTNFDGTEDRSQKLNILKDVSDDYESYINDSSKFGNNQELIDEYKSNIDHMKQWFLDDYKANIDFYTIDDNALAADVVKDHISGFKDSLDTILNTINSEKEIINYDEAIEPFIQTINDLKTKYDARLNAIAAEEQKRAEEEAAAQKAKEEEAKKQQEQNKQSSSKSNSGSSNESNSNGGGNKGNSNNGGGSSKPSNNGGGSGNPYKDPSLGYKMTYYVEGNGYRTEVYYYDDGTIWFHDCMKGTWEDITGNGDIFG